jgi:hypothetical protein
MSFFPKYFFCSDGGNERSLGLVVHENKEAREREGERDGGESTREDIIIYFGQITCSEKKDGVYSPTI